MSGDQAQLDIVVNNKPGLDSVAEFESRSQEAVEHVGEMFEHLKHVAEAALVFLAVEKLVEFGQEAIKLAAEQEQGQKRLATAMELNGQAADGAAEEMQKFAEELQNHSRFSEEAVTSNLAYAESLGLTNEQAQKTVQTGADLAAELGTDLNTQVEKLTRTFTGHLGLLTKTHPELKQFSEEQLQAGAAVQFFADKIHGAAEKDIHTYEGATLQAKNAQDDFLKSLGRMVTDSPIMIARLESMAESWRSLKEWVVENKDEIQVYVDGGLTLLVQAVPAAASVVYYLAQGFEAVTGATLLFANGVSMVVHFVEDVLIKTVRELVDTFFNVAEAIDDGVAAIPGARAAFAGMGVDIDAADEKLRDAHGSFDMFVDGTLEGSQRQQDALMNFTVSVGDAFEKTDAKFDAFQLALETTAQKILDADIKVGDSAETVAKKRDAANAKSKKLYEELAKELIKLDDGIFQASATEAEKAVKQYNEWFDEIERLRNAHMIGDDQADARQFDAKKIYLDKLAKIHKEELDKEAADAAKARADQATAIAAAAAAPAPFIVAVLIDQDSLQKVQDEIAESMTAGVNGARHAFAKFFSDDGTDTGVKDWTEAQVTQGFAAGLGAASSMLDGAAGAGKFISATAGAIANAYMPGLGPVVQGIVDKLESGPGPAKAFVEGFFDALPQILEHIADAIPAVVEGVIDEIFTINFWTKMFNAYIHVMDDWITIVPRSLGKSFGESLTASHIGATMAREFTKDMEYFNSRGAEQWGTQAGTAWTKGTHDFFTGLQSAGDKLRTGWTEAPANIAKSFHDASDYMTGHVGDSLKHGADAMLAAIGKAGTDLFNGLGKPFAEAGKGFISALGDAFPKFSMPKFEWPHLDTPGWVQDFKGAVDKLAGVKIPGTSGGGGGGGFISQVFGKHAQGLDVVPAGYDQDNYVAGLKSGEGVVDAGTNADLRKMVKDYASGGGNREVVAALNQIAQLLAQPQTVAATAKVDSRAFADITLQLSRQNARLRA